MRLEETSDDLLLSQYAQLDPLGLGIVIGLQPARLWTLQISECWILFIVERGDCTFCELRSVCCIGHRWSIVDDIVSALKRSAE